MKKTLAILISLLLTFPVTVSAETKEAKYVENELIVTCKDDVNIHKEVDGDVEEIIDNTYVVTIDDDTSLNKEIKKLENNDEIESVQKNYIYTLQSTVTIDDSYQNYSLNNVNAKDAWGEIDTNNKATVAVLDTGINYDPDMRHEDLQDVSDGGNILYEYAYDAYYNLPLKDSIWEIQDNETSYIDYEGHGSEVAAIIGATCNNSKGMAGIGGNCVNVLPINIFGDIEENDENYVASNATSASIASAYDYVMQYADELNIKVVNMSIGTSSSIPDDTLLKDAINNAYEHNIVTVAAAGNNGSSKKFYPASYDHVISVAAIDSKDEAASYSQHNSAIDICAPGSNIQIPYAGEHIDKDGNIFNYGTDEYKKGSGTSYAAPIVAAAIALLFVENPDLTSEQAETVLESSAIDLGDTGIDDYYGYGKVNIYHSILACKANQLTMSHYNQMKTVEQMPTATTYAKDVEQCKYCSYHEDGASKVVPVSSITLSTTSYTYNGKAKKPSVTVYYKTKAIGSKLTASTSYATIKYPSGRTKVGTYTISVTGKDVLSGTVKKSFTIVPKPTKFIYTKSYKYSVYLKWTKITSQVTGYQIRYSTNSSMSNAKTKTSTSYKTTVTGLKRKKTYYFQIRTYKTVSGKKYYSSWSTVKKKTTL